MITGDDATMYQVPALPAGTYAFNCYAHPATMFGTLTVG
jgi:plastocyanin